MPRNYKIKETVVDLLNQWLGTAQGQLSEDRLEILSARDKICKNLKSLTPEEAEAITACVMELIDVESIKADDIIGFVQDMVFMDEKRQ